MMQLDWGKLNMFFFCTFLESGATIEPNHRFAKMQQLWQKINVSNFLTLTANLQHSELDCPVFQFQSTCISWLTKVKATSLQSKEQTSMLLSGQQPPCKPTEWCYSKGLLNSRPTCPTPLPRSTNVFPAISNLHSSQAIMRFVKEKRIANGNLPMSLDIRGMWDSP
jgi:hypothetical protein